jgi:hypothetical protein
VGPDYGVWTAQPVTKSPTKLRRQMEKRGWTAAQIEEAVAYSERYPSSNLATGRPATRYVHPSTGRSVVIDDVTGEVIHVGGNGFQY